MDNFINTFKSIDHDTTEYRLSTTYTTDNEKYIWRDEDNHKVDNEAHYVLLKRRNDGKLVLAIGKDAPDDEYYDDEDFYEEIESYKQDDESDSEFYQFCKDIVKNNNLIINDSFDIDLCISNGEIIDSTIEDGINDVYKRRQSRKPLIFD